MIYLLFLALLAWVVPVGADDSFTLKSEPSISSIAPDSGLWNHKQADHKPDTCLAQMEQAMRAVDQFLAKAFLDGTGRIKSPGYTEKGKAELERAYQQWDTAKRDCWRMP